MAHCHSCEVVQTADVNCSCTFIFFGRGWPKEVVDQASRMRLATFLPT